MKKYYVGIVFGFFAGIIDAVIMILQNLAIKDILSVLAFWVIVGYLISTIDIRINRILKGIIVSILVLIPIAIPIVWTDPISLIPITIITIVLGSLLGFSIQRFGNK